MHFSRKYMSNSGIWLYFMFVIFTGMKNGVCDGFMSNIATVCCLWPGPPLTRGKDKTKIIKNPPHLLNSDLCEVI